MNLLITTFYAFNFNDNLQPVLPFHCFANATTIFFRNSSLKWHMKETSIHAPFKIKCSRVLKIWHWRNFQTQHVLLQYVMFFYNSIVTRFCGLDVSLCFSIFDSSISFTPSVFKKDLSDYKNKVKNSKHPRAYSRPILRSTIEGCRLLPKLCKAFFWCKTLRTLPKFLECSLHALICSKKSYICKLTEMTCWKVEVLNYYNSSSYRRNLCIFLQLP